jgi:hypothetical protein
MSEKKCNHCGEWKDEEDFSWRYKSLGIRNKACKKCMVEFNRNYYQGEAGERHLQQVKERTDKARAEAKEFVYQFLLTHPCQSCGEADPRVLEFHHREPSRKDMDITHMLSGGYSLRRLQAEIAKCDVLCANCHRKVTVEERGWFRSHKNRR